MSKAFQDLGEAEGLPGLRENAAGSGPWGERVSLESRDQKEASAAVALAGRRVTTGEMELAMRDAEARKENEVFPDTQGRRVPPVSPGRTEHRDPKA